MPGPVRNLKATSVQYVSQSPSISLTWSPPANCTSTDDVKHYHIDILAQQTVGKQAYRLWTIRTHGSVTDLKVNCEDGLLPLVNYNIEVKAESQEGRFGEYVLCTVFVRKCFSMQVHRT